MNLKQAFSAAWKDFKGALAKADAFITKEAPAIQAAVQTMKILISLLISAALLLAQYSPPSGGGGGSPGGPNKAVQINDSGSFGGNSGFTFDKVTGNVAIGSTVPGGAPASSLALAGRYYGDGSGLTGLSPTNSCTQIVGALNGPCKISVSAAQLATIGTGTANLQLLSGVAGKSYFVTASYAVFNFVSTPTTGDADSDVGMYLGGPGLDTNYVYPPWTLAYLYLPFSASSVTGGAGSAYTGSDYGAAPVVGQSLNLYGFYTGTVLPITWGDGTLDIYLTYLLI